MVFAKAGTATASLCQLRDNTTATYKIITTISWSGAVGTFACTTGTLVGQWDAGSGWYGALVSATWTSGNVPRIELYGASATVAATGTTTWYLRNAVLLDILGMPKSFSRPRTGYEAATSPSGTRDAWSYGNEEVLQARTSWIPTSARVTPQLVSGWYGAADTAGVSCGVNCGVKAMMEAGWAQGLLRYAADRTAPTTYVDAYLTQPGMQWAPELEGSADRAFQMELVSPSSVFRGL
jgi:hypothetical protein